MIINKISKPKGKAKLHCKCILLLHIICHCIELLKMMTKLTGTNYFGCFN